MVKSVCALRVEAQKLIKEGRELVKGKSLYQIEEPHY